MVSIFLAPTAPWLTVVACARALHFHCFSTLLCCLQISNSQLRSRDKMQSGLKLQLGGAGGGLGGG